MIIIKCDRCGVATEMGHQGSRGASELPDGWSVASPHNTAASDMDLCHGCMESLVCLETGLKENRDEALAVWLRAGQGE